MKGNAMTVEKDAEEVLRALNGLSRSLRANEARVAKAYARLAGRHGEAFMGLSATDALVIEIIAGQARVNGMLVAERIGMTKGGVSKIMARLQEKGLVKARKLKDDYKSNYYGLTASGKKALRLHQRFLALAAAGVGEFLQTYSEAERVFALRFAVDAAAALDAISEQLDAIAQDDEARGS